MASLSARRIAKADYHTIRLAVSDAVRQSCEAGKQWPLGVDMDVVMPALYGLDHAYIVEGYLVAFEIASPWYSNELFLQEIIVCRLNGNDFGVVPAFLEQEARRAGCAMVLAGTALARNDAALARLYRRFGFHTETHTVTKELEWDLS